MGRMIVIFCSLIAVIVYTLYSFWLPIEGKSTIEIINRLPILIAPATYVYIFWFFFLFFYLFGQLIIQKIVTSETFISPIQTILFLLVMIFQITSITY